jgi:hypothetical protein
VKVSFHSLLPPDGFHTLNAPLNLTSENKRAVWFGRLTPNTKVFAKTFYDRSSLSKKFVQFPIRDEPRAPCSDALPLQNEFEFCAVKTKMKEAITAKLRWSGVRGYTLLKTRQANLTSYSAAHHARRIFDVGP